MGGNTSKMITKISTWDDDAQSKKKQAPYYIFTAIVSVCEKKFNVSQSDNLATDFTNYINNNQSCASLFTSMQCVSGNADDLRRGQKRLLIALPETFKMKFTHNETGGESSFMPVDDLKQEYIVGILPEGWQTHSIQSIQPTPTDTVYFLNKRGYCGIGGEKRDCILTAGQAYMEAINQNRVDDEYDVFLLAAPFDVLVEHYDEVFSVKNRNGANHTLDGFRILPPTSEAAQQKEYNKTAFKSPTRS